MLLSDRLYKDAPIIDLGRRPSFRRVLAAAVRSASHNLVHRPKQSDVLIIASGSGLLPRQGRAYNRYADPFAGLLGDRSWTMEGLLGDMWPQQARSNPRLGFLGIDRLRIAIVMRAASSRSDRLLASNLVEIAASRGRDLFGWDVGSRRRSFLIDVGARRLAAYSLRARLADRLLRRTSAKLVLLEDACFGYNAVFNASARDRGVRVAEFQHGMITAGHDGYNVHPLLERNQAYRRTLPAEILTYGEWWDSQFNAPVGRVPIGNPDRTETLRHWGPAGLRDRVVVLGDGIETEMYLRFCRELASAIASSQRVAFRPHPLERARVAALVDEPFTVDQEPDLYRSLASASAVVGEYSTALFEAVGLVPKVLVWDTEKSRFYLGVDHPFTRVADATEVPPAVAASSQVEGVAQAMWASDWRHRFASYVDRVLAGP
jgi:hypothetical protein